jgi:hypothetical protein
MVCLNTCLKISQLYAKKKKKRLILVPIPKISQKNNFFKKLVIGPGITDQGPSFDSGCLKQRTGVPRF